MIRVFVDLDDTLVEYCEDGQFRVDGDTEGPYNLAHGGKEFLQALLSNPRLRLHFYSGGPSTRNLGLITQILQEIQVDPTDENVFSAEHLVPGNPPKKQLSALPIDGLDVEQSIVVDDTPYYYAAKGEERNFLHIYSCHCDGHSHFAGKVFDMRRNNRLIRALGMILWCLEMTEPSSSNSSTFVEALQAIQWDSDTRVYRHNDTNSAEIYQRGLEAMRRFTPELQLMDSEQLGIWPWSCKFVEESLGYEPDAHFQSSNFFEEDQIARLMSFSCAHVTIQSTAVVNNIMEEVVDVEIEWIGENKTSLSKLPAGIPAVVVVATLDKIHPVDSSGILYDIHGKEIEPLSLLHSSSTYKYKVLRAY